MNWRGAFLVVRTVRDWRGILGGLLLTVIAAAVISRTQSGFAKVVIFYGPPLIVLTILGGVIRHVRRPMIWRTLTQRPVRDEAELRRVAAVAMGFAWIATLAILLGAFAGLAANPEVQDPAMRSLVATSLLWAVQSTAAVSAMCVVVLGNAAAASFAWLISPVLLGMLADGSALVARWRSLIEFALPPLDAVVLVARAATDPAVALDGVYLAQLVSFPILCLAIIAWRFRRLARSEQMTPE
jgi:hypothetical protein